MLHDITLKTPPPPYNAFFCELLAKLIAILVWSESSSTTALGVKLV